MICKIDGEPYFFSHIAPVYKTFRPFYDNLDTSHPTANCFEDILDRFVVKKIILKDFSTKNKSDYQKTLTVKELRQKHSTRTRLQQLITYYYLTESVADYSHVVRFFTEPQLMQKIFRSHNVIKFLPDKTVLDQDLDEIVVQKLKEEVRAEQARHERPPWITVNPDILSLGYAGGYAENFYATSSANVITGSYIHPFIEMAVNGGILNGSYQFSSEASLVRFPYDLNRQHILYSIFWKNTVPMFFDTQFRYDITHENSVSKSSYPFEDLKLGQHEVRQSIVQGVYDGLPVGSGVRLLPMASYYLSSFSGSAEREYDSSGYQYGIDINIPFAYLSAVNIEVQSFNYAFVNLQRKSANGLSLGQQEVRTGVEVDAYLMIGERQKWVFGTRKKVSGSSTYFNYNSDMFYVSVSQQGTAFLKGEISGYTNIVQYPDRHLVGGDFQVKTIYNLDIQLVFDVFDNLSVFLNSGMFSEKSNFDSDVWSSRFLAGFAIK